MSLDREVKKLVASGVRRLYGKALAPNDNSKNQVYLGPSISSVNLLPVKEIVGDPENSKRLKGPLDFYWLSEQGLALAPNAQVILYPEYPEVRFSGFLKGCAEPPSELMTSRAEGRVLLLGVREDDSIVGRMLAPSSAAAKEFIARAGQGAFQAHGPLLEIATPDAEKDDGFHVLATRLSAIHSRKWIDAWRLGSGGERLACIAPQCGGYTLEAELGIRPNGRSEPDFLGWEIKSFTVPSVDTPSPPSKALTLMTPEPTGGMYHDDFESFWRRYSYEDQSKKASHEGQRNFGGIYRCGATAHERTRLSLSMEGFDVKTGRFAANGELVLKDQSGQRAASWSFGKLLEKWSRKHARAVYVPVQKHADQNSYRYGSTVRTGRGTDFTRFLTALAAGAVYLDPAVTLKAGEDRPHKRSQFRARFSDLDALYGSFSAVDVTSPFSR